jgi:hypothetical protein
MPAKYYKLMTVRIIVHFFHPGLMLSMATEQRGKSQEERNVDLCAIAIQLSDPGINKVRFFRQKRLFFGGETI